MFYEKITQSTVYSKITNKDKEEADLFFKYKYDFKIAEPRSEKEKMNALCQSIQTRC